jgi:hypothetical protein
MITGDGQTLKKELIQIRIFIPLLVVLVCTCHNQMNRLVVIVLFKNSYIYKKSGSHKNSLLFRSNFGWKGNMVGMFLAATFVFPTGPQHIDHRVDDLAGQGCTTWVWLLGGRISKNKGYAATLSLLAIAATIDTHSGNARVGAQTIHLLARSIEDVVLGDEAAHIADVLCVFPRLHQSNRLWFPDTGGRKRCKHRATSNKRCRRFVSSRE